MNKLLNIYKPIGKTPLEVINQLRIAFPEYKDEKISYAGRLDPMAHGVLLLMVGEAASERDKYLSLPKTYTFEVVFGMATDTYDVLGMIQPPLRHARLDLGSRSLLDSSLRWNDGKEKSNVNLIVNSFVNGHIGKQLQLYPPYSSKTVQGKALFQWAKEGKLDEIELPTHEIEVYDFKLLSLGDITKLRLKSLVLENIGLVKGDFRQEKIQEQWKGWLQASNQSSFQTASFEITCSSGTYVRSLANELGKEVGGAIAIDIKRTKVGEYTIADSLFLFG
jgi:tRNA pseudouridine55 synthase